MVEKLILLAGGRPRPLRYLLEQIAGRVQHQVRGDILLEGKDHLLERGRRVALLSDGPGVFDDLLDFLGNRRPGLNGLPVRPKYTHGNLSLSDWRRRRPFQA